MRVLVFGSQGMLGRVLTQELSSIAEVFGTSMDRSGADICGIDIAMRPDIERAIERSSPDVIVNCAGVVKSECSDPYRAWTINARAPIEMAEAAQRRGCKLVHVSTDCVFSGRAGDYRETDIPDPEDLYGRSKAAGELSHWPDCLTLRTSFIGRDPRRHRGLVEWLLASKGAVPGFTRAIWSGLTAQELSRAISRAIVARNLTGLYHVAGPRICKADLLELLVRAMALSCKVDRVDGDAIDRSLNGSRFAAATGYVSPPWAEMIEELANA